ncbi:MAG: Ig-like domain-containing protein, partial [Bacillota bacterium]
MKKIIICMLLLLPLIIVASVMLAIDIISVEAYIPVEKVVLNHKYLELDLREESFDDLVATVYPTSATNKDVEWTITDEVKTVENFEGDAATVNENGKVEFFTYATFKVVAMASGKSASCTFYIKSDKVEDVEIVSDDSEIATGEKIRLEAVFHPIDADVEDILWESEDQSILKVDNNGIISGVSQGVTTVTVRVKDTLISSSI